MSAWVRVGPLAPDNCMGKIPGNGPCGPTRSRRLPGMAAINTLSDKAIKSAIKAAGIAGKSHKLNDGGGLLLEARPNGVGWWRLRYWLASKEGMLSLGVYPDVPLVLARERRDEARKMIAAGTDPSAARKSEKAADIARAEAARLAAAAAVKIALLSPFMISSNREVHVM